MTQVLEPDILIDSHRLDVMMALQGIKTDEQLEVLSGVTTRTLRNIRNTGKCSFTVWLKLAKALDHNPIDFLKTPGFPSPKLDAPAFRLPQKTN